jgi:ACS family glucarate transporter-like MFS transporter
VRAQRLDIGREHAGAVFGFMNTAANAASAISSVVFGYIVALTGSYNAPLIPMAAALFVGAWLWLQIDPTQQLFEDERDLAA